MLFDETLNGYYLLIILVSQTNKDILYYYKAMRAKDISSFREAMSKEIDSFQQEDIFKFIPIEKKPPNQSLIPFVWSFKHKKIL